MTTEGRENAGEQNELDLEKLASRILEGEIIDIDELCQRFPAQSAQIRGIARDVAGLAGEHTSGSDAGDSAAKDPLNEATVRTATHSHRGSFDNLLDLIRERQGSARYRMRGSIATGGMGAILRVHDEILRRPLAMKVILGKGEADPTGATPSVDDRTLGRFLDEANVTAQLDHPGIVPVHELGVDQAGRVYFTMKLVKGETFADIIERVHRGDPEWSMTRAIGVLLRVAEAMAYAHRKNVLHRDLKPSNIMVGRFGEVYVMDWGLARVMGEQDRRDLRIRIDASSNTQTEVTTPRRSDLHDDPDTPLITMDGDVVGTPAYMPPEQAEGRIDELGPRSDIYSLGAMLYHLLSGQCPYVRAGKRMSARTILTLVLEGPPKPLTEIAKSQPAALLAICDKAMSREPKHRYDEMENVANDLRAYLEGRVVRAYRTGPMAELTQWVRRNRAAAWSIFAALLIVSLLTIGFVYRIERDRTSLEKRNNEYAQKEKEKRWSDYVSGIRGAQWLLNAGDFRGFRAAMDSCPEEHRGWEWGYLSTLNGTSILQLVDIHSNPCWSIDGKILYYVRNRSLESVEIESGRTKVLCNDLGVFARQIDVSSKVIVVLGVVPIVNGFEFKIVTLDIESGKVLWDRAIESGDDVLISLGERSDQLFVLDDRGRVGVYDVNRGNVRETVSLVSEPYILDNPMCLAAHPNLPIAIVGSRNGLSLLNFGSGFTLHRLLESEFQSSPGIGSRSTGGGSGAARTKSHMVVGSCDDVRCDHDVSAVSFCLDGEHCVAAVGGVLHRMRLDLGPLGELRNHSVLNSVDVAEFMTVRQSDTNAHQNGSSDGESCELFTPVVGCADLGSALGALVDGQVLLGGAKGSGMRLSNLGEVLGWRTRRWGDRSGIATSVEGLVVVWMSRVAVVMSSLDPALPPWPAYSGCRGWTVKAASVNDRGHVLACLFPDEYSSSDGLSPLLRIVNLTDGTSWTLVFDLGIIDVRMSANAATVAVIDINSVYTVDANTGLIVKKCTLDETPTGLALDDTGEHIAVATNSKVCLIESRSGRIVWSANTDADYEGLVHSIKSNSISFFSLVSRIGLPRRFEVSLDDVSVSSRWGFVGLAQSGANDATVWSVKTGEARRVTAPMYILGDSGNFALSNDGSRILRLAPQAKPNADFGGLPLSSIISWPSADELARFDRVGHLPRDNRGDSTRVLGWPSQAETLLCSSGYGDLIALRSTSAAILRDHRHRMDIELINSIIPSEDQMGLDYNIPELINVDGVDQGIRDIALRAWGIRNKLAMKYPGYSLASECMDGSISLEESNLLKSIAENEVDATRTFHRPHLGMGAALLRCGEYESARNEFLLEVRENLLREPVAELKSFTDADGRTRWKLEVKEIVHLASDELRAWLALAEAKLGVPHAPPRGLEFDQVRLDKDSDIRLVHLVHEARAACGMEINPEGIDFSAKDK